MSHFYDHAMEFLSIMKNKAQPVQDIAELFRVEHCEKLHSVHHKLYEEAVEWHEAHPKSAPYDRNFHALQARLYLALVVGIKRECLTTLKQLREQGASCIDEVVMEGVPAEVITREGALAGEGAMVYVCDDIKQMVERAQKSVELALRLDMALQKFGLSFWK